MDEEQQMANVIAREVAPVIRSEATDRSNPLSMNSIAPFCPRYLTTVLQRATTWPLIGLLLLSVSVSSQWKLRDGRLTSRADSEIASAEDLVSALHLQETSLSDGSPRSPLVAGLLSAAVPGLGQAYAEDWTFNWRSAAYAAAEVALWTAAISYSSKADHQTDGFERFADEHWDVTRYAGWIENNIGELLPGGANTSGMVVSSDPAQPPWDRVNWIRINEVEEAIGQRSGTGFTHRLPRRPEQQYYELIGKYAQYGGGWDDADTYTPTDLLADRVSPRFLEYSRMRGRANDLYSVATTASYLIVANHVISALEAAWSASRANRPLEARAEMRGIDRGAGMVERVPHVVIEMNL